MSTYTFAKLMFLSTVLLACGQQRPSLNDFDAERWKNDRNGCERMRGQLSNSLIVQQEAILGSDEMEIVEMLGKPDEQELYKRNQKFFYYYIDPAKICGDSTSSSRRLVIRFNAVGLAKDLTIE